MVNVATSSSLTKIAGMNRRNEKCQIQWSCTLGYSFPWHKVLSPDHILRQLQERVLTDITDTHKFKVTFGIAIPEDGYFVGRKAVRSSRNKVCKEVTSEEVGGDVGVRDPCSLNSPSDPGLRCKCWPCWLHGMDAVHVVTKLRWEEPLQNPIKIRKLFYKQFTALKYLVTRFLHIHLYWYGLRTSPYILR